MKPELDIFYNQKGFNWNVWKINSASKPFPFNFSCLQDVLRGARSKGDAELVEVTNQ